eukprot:s1382_g6.t1
MCHCMSACSEQDEHQPRSIWKRENFDLLQLRMTVWTNSPLATTDAFQAMVQPARVANKTEELLQLVLNLKGDDVRSEDYLSTRGANLSHLRNIVTTVDTTPSSSPCRSKLWTHQADGTSGWHSHLATPDEAIVRIKFPSTWAHACMQPKGYKPFLFAQVFEEVVGGNRLQCVAKTWQQRLVTWGKKTKRANAVCGNMLE